MQPTPKKIILNDLPTYLVEEILLANCSNFANVVEKAGRSFCCTVGFVDTNVPKPLQEIGPGISSYPVSDGNTDLVIPVSVALERRGEYVYLYTYACCMFGYTTDGALCSYIHP